MPQVPTGEIAEVQLLELFLQVNGDIDTQFQVWISITFAVLVASFVAGPRLSPGARVAIVVLYLSAAVILYLRYTRAVSYIPYVFSVYDAYGVTPPQTSSGVAFLLRLGLFWIGSGVAAVGVLFPGLGLRPVVSHGGASGLAGGGANEGG